LNRYAKRKFEINATLSFRRWCDTRAEKLEIIQPGDACRCALSVLGVNIPINGNKYPRGIRTAYITPMKVYSAAERSRAGTLARTFDYVTLGVRFTRMM